MQMSAGQIEIGGIIVSGFASISGGSINASNQRGDFHEFPGPWNLVATDRGPIQLSGAALDPLVRTAARDHSTIRICGTGFAVDGVPVRYGLIKKPTDKLSGVLKSGDAIDNAFGHRGADCDGVACTGKSMRLPPKKHRRD